MEASEPGASDTGDVWLHVFDEDFNLLEQQKLTNYGSGRDSAMRPWMERKDDLLLVSYDILTKHTFVAVKLNLDGVEAVDTGFAGEGTGSDELPELAVDTSKSGCAVAGGSAGGLLFVLGMVAARRRDDP